MGKKFEVFTIKTQKQQWKNNVYVIIDPETKDALLVDPSWEYERIVTCMKKQEVKLQGILITHTHYDHVNLVKNIQEEYGAVVYIGEKENIPDCLEGVNLRLVNDFKNLKIGSIPVTVIETSGHSKGSVCYRIGKHLFSGDTLFIEGCGICETEKAAADMFHSIQKLKTHTTMDTLIYPGHTYYAEPGQNMKYLYDNNIYLSFEKSENFVKFRMRKQQKNLFAFQ